MGVTEMGHNKLISFFVPSRRLDEAKGLLDSLQENTADPQLIEVLFKFDDDETQAKNFIQEEQGRRPFDVKYIITPPGEANYSLWLDCNRLFFMTSKESYFIQLLSDEVRIVTPNWDNLLKRYVGFFPDHIFRLRTSSQRMCNYYTQYECNYIPDSFPIYTRTWLTLTQGLGDCWGSDVYHQAVAFHMGLGIDGYRSAHRIGALYRDVDIHEIKYAGSDLYGVDVKGKALEIRRKWIQFEWDRMSSHCKQEEFSYLAKRIYLYTLANKKNLKQFKLLKDEKRKTVTLFDMDQYKNVSQISYAVPVFYVIFSNMRRKYLKIKHRLNPKVQRGILGMFYLWECLIFPLRALLGAITYMLGFLMLIPVLLMRLLAFVLKAFRAVIYYGGSFFSGIKSIGFKFFTMLQKAIVPLAYKMKLNHHLWIKNLVTRWKLKRALRKLKSDARMQARKRFRSHCIKNILAIERFFHRTSTKFCGITTVIFQERFSARAHYKKRVCYDFLLIVKYRIQYFLFDCIAKTFYQMPATVARMKSNFSKSFFLRSKRLPQPCKVQQKDIGWFLATIQEEMALKKSMETLEFHLPSGEYDNKKYPDLGYW